MAEPGSTPTIEASLRDSAEKLALAAVGAVALTGDRIEELVDELARRGGMRRDEARDLVGDLTTRWRGDAQRVGEKAGLTLGGTFRELGLVTRREWEELELRLAQVEHRLRLVEKE
jgi:polyhydroxyalkanoate synthesis regulator phasin